MCSLHPVRHMILCPIIDPTISQPAELRVIPGAGWLKMAVSSPPDSQTHFKSPLSCLCWCFPAAAVAGASLYNVGKHFTASLKISLWLHKVQCNQRKESTARCIMWIEGYFKQHFVKWVNSMVIIHLANENKKSGEWNITFQIRNIIITQPEISSKKKKKSICIKRYDNLGNASPDVFIVINTSLQFLMLYNFLMFVTTLRGIEERQALIVNLHMLYCRCNGMSTFNRIVIPVNYADSDMHLSLLKLIVLFGQLVASQYVVSFSLRLSMLRARKWQEKESLHTKQAPLAQPHSRLKKEKSR